MRRPRRSIGESGTALAGWGETSPAREPTALHELRVQAVCGALDACGARSVADLGCGAGILLRRLLRQDGRFDRIVGVDVALPALASIERGLPPDAQSGGRLVLVHGSFTDRHRELAGVEAVAMLETIEHVEPDRLSRVEQLVFGDYRPRTVVVTTPNREYNVLFGMAPGELRDPDHRFEWTRGRFRGWAAGVALRHGYAVALRGLGEADRWRGSPTQMAEFTRI
jgi:small RNA 2'-O-methyltransferase